MAAAMAVLSPMQTGLGGDAFLLSYEAETGRVTGVNGAGRAPGGATVEKLRDLGLDQMPERGGLTVTVPGAVRLWEDAANVLGNLPLARLLEPAWEFAENGRPVAEVVARYWEENEDILRANEAAARTFLPDGRPPAAGEPFYQVDLASTISAVAQGAPTPSTTGR
jgi:gamma-glutamyltranspeptidase / glutathione hydrolase